MQYFLRISDDDVERYLRLFTFFPLTDIALAMKEQRRDPSRRPAQHLLAREMLKLAHGADAASVTERAHRSTFSQGTQSLSLAVIRKRVAEVPSTKHLASLRDRRSHYSSSESIDLPAHKARYVAASNAQAASPATDLPPSDVVVLPRSLLDTGCFPTLFVAAGLAASKSEFHRLVEAGGAYAADPDPGAARVSDELPWAPIGRASGSPEQRLVDGHVLVLRSGKRKIRICRFTDDSA